MKTTDRVKKVAGIVLEISPAEISDEMNLAAELAADSLDLVQIVMALEDEFGITIPEEEAVELKSVKQMADFIDRKSAGRELVDVM